jgi:voltage-gated potassium channel Kch
MVSIAISAYMMIYVDDMYKYLRRILKVIEFRKNNIKMLDEDAKDLDAVIFGFDRVGHKFVDVFLELKFKYLVIDINPKYVQSAIESGVRAIYGDAEDLGFLQENNILNSNMLISTIPHFKTNLFLVESYRKKNKDGVIVVIAQDEAKSKELYSAGATYVIMPYHLGAYHASKMLLEFKKNPKIFEKEKKIQFDMMLG